MKQLISFFLVVLAGSAAFGQNSPESELYRKKFWDQIAVTCQLPVQWEKSVEELDEGNATSKQSKVFTIDCRKGTAVETSTGKENVLAPSEFAELFKYRYDDPYLRDYLKVVASGGSVTAELPEQEMGEIALQKQAFEVDSATGILRYAEVKVMKSNLLYDFELRTRVWFDENGLYLRHTTETFTKVVLSGSVRTIIEGKRLS
jgi:hypothetical protein